MFSYDLLRSLQYFNAFETRRSVLHLSKSTIPLFPNPDPPNPLPRKLGALGWKFERFCWRVLRCINFRTVYLTVYLMVLLSRQPVVEEAPGGITLGRVPQGGPPPPSPGRGIPHPRGGSPLGGGHTGERPPLGAVGVQMKTHWSEVSHFAYPRWTKMASKWSKFCGK